MELLLNSLQTHLLVETNSCDLVTPITYKFIHLIILFTSCVFAIRQNMNVALNSKFINHAERFQTFKYLIK